jgi:FkbM family methyltransferase
MLISYAQNFEDIILLRALHGVEHGFYIDIGANDPHKHSISKAFYERGWYGVNVEASPHFADLLRNARSEETIIEKFVSNEVGPVIFFDVEDTGLGTSDRALAAIYAEQGRRVTERKIETISLDLLLESNKQDDIHWLKIDVEGAEEAVLKSWNASEKRPWIVVVEATVPLTNVAKHDDWEPIVLSKGYHFAYFDGLNRFYVHETKMYLMKAFGPGPNIFDGKLITGEMEYPVTEDAIAPLIKNIEKLQEKDFHKDHELSTMREEVKSTKLVFDQLQNILNYNEKKNGDLAVDLSIKIEKLEREYQEILKLEQQKPLLQNKIQLILIEKDLLSGELELVKEEKKEEIGKLQSIVEQQAKALKDLYTEIADRDDMITKYENKINIISVNLNWLESHVKILNIYINEIYNSTYWKITAPIRRFSLNTRWKIRKLKRVKSFKVRVYTKRIFDMRFVKNIKGKFSKIFVLRRRRLDHVEMTRVYGESVSIVPKKFHPLIQPEANSFVAWKDLVDNGE